MKNFYLVKLLAFKLINFFFETQTTFAQCHNNDWNALKALYESTNGDNWIISSGWEKVNGDERTVICSLGNLFGVHITNGRVTFIDLEGDNDCHRNSLPVWNNLIGSIPSDLEYLNNLEQLHLAGNNFSNSGIPIELGNLTNLTHLDLYGNKLEDSVPAELGNLTNLRELVLWTNKLSGSIPPQLGNLSNLTTFNPTWLF